MKRILLYLLPAILVSLLAVGCDGGQRHRVTSPARTHDNPNAKPEEVYIEEYLNRDAVLPTGATKIRPLGNGWMTFELQVEGKTRKFMYGRFKSHQDAVPAIVELQQ